MSLQKTFLNMRNISKHFGGVHAVKQVNLEVNQGEILALVGENGAGKSTLMNILSGVTRKDEGQIQIDDKPYEPQNPKDAQEIGISFIHQELTLFPSLTVGENMFIGSFPGVAGFVSHKRTNQAAKAVLDKLCVDINVRSQVSDLSIGDRQLVEIAKAVVSPIKLIIFDEPTSSLTGTEKDHLFEVIRGLRSQGTAVIYISHFLDEIMAISDRICVMRDGKNAGSLITSETNKDEIIKFMVGREIRSALTRSVPVKKSVVLKVENVRREGYLEDINFDLHESEILGIWGLLGSGRTELARAIFGLDPLDGGQVILEGTEIQGKTPSDISKAGIGYLTENRRDDGLLLEKTIRENITLASLKHCATFPFGKIRRKQENQVANDLMQKLRIVTPSTEQTAQNLSGGNQQKVVLAKWLALGPKVYILDEPTRGVDVGAKNEIHQQIMSLVEKGASVILISNEMEETMRLSDRILVMHKGKIRGEVSPENASQDTLVKYTTLKD